MALRGTSRKITIVVLAILTLGLGALAVFIGIQLQQQQAPDDTFAGVKCSPATSATDCPSGQSCVLVDPQTGTYECREVADPCAAYGETCSAYLGFKCTQADRTGDGQCNANLREFGDFGSASAYVDGCGQVDKVCTGGRLNNGNYVSCGEFQIIQDRCEETPPPTNTVQCGQSCDGTTTLCAAGNTCTGGTCVSTACANNPSGCTNSCPNTTVTAQATPRCVNTTPSVALSWSPGAYTYGGGTETNGAYYLLLISESNTGVTLAGGDYWYEYVKTQSTTSVGANFLTQAGTFKSWDGSTIGSALTELDPNKQYYFGVLIPKQANAPTTDVASVSSGWIPFTTQDCSEPPVVTAECGESCSTDAECTQSGHSCDGGTCKLDTCIADADACDPTGCTVESDLTVEKDSQLASCTEGQPTSINYTITVTNTTATEATLDEVVDTLPSSMNASNSVSNVSPSGATLANNTITWDGPFTIAANGTKTFTYKLSLTAAQVNTFETNGVDNTVEITFGVNTANYQHVTNLSCLPITGLFDEDSRPLLIGLLLILTGLVANRVVPTLNLLGEFNTQINQSRERKRIQNKREEFESRISDNLD